MKRTTGLVLALILAPMAATAQKITLDYAKGFDFPSMETYTVTGIAKADPSNQLSDDRTRHAIIRELHRCNLLTASKDPDLLIEYQFVPADTGESESSAPSPTNPGPGWTGWDSASPTPTTALPTGTLLIVATDTASGELVWRASGTMKTTKKPEKQHVKIDKIVAKLGKQWRLILAGQGK